MESVLRLVPYCARSFSRGAGIRTESKLLIGSKHIHGKGRLNLQLLLGQPRPLLGLVVLDGDVGIHCDGVCSSRERLLRLNAGICASIMCAN